MDSASNMPGFDMYIAGGYDRIPPQFLVWVWNRQAWQLLCSLLVWSDVHYLKEHIGTPIDNA